jgi:hypothetical protein
LLFLADAHRFKSQFELRADSFVCFKIEKVLVKEWKIFQ